MTSITSKINRCPEINESELTSEQRRVWDRIASGPRGKVEGPLRVWLQSPTLADRAQQLGQFARYDSSLSKKLSELAIIVTGRIWASAFEWSHHAPLALEAGVPSEAIRAISLGKRPDFADEEMAVVFDFAVELHRERAVTDATFARATEFLGTRGVVDLVGI